MSIAHLGIPDAPPDFEDETRGFERVPPHDLLAEQSVLGGMLLSKDAVADVTGQLRPGDFYVPKHEVIYEAVLTLYAQGEPTDVITVTDQLTKSGDLQRAGGAEYLHTLTSIVPTAANATRPRRNGLRSGGESLSATSCAKPCASFFSAA